MSAEVAGPGAKAVLVHLCQSVVSEPDQVSVGVSPGGEKIRFDVRVAKSDMGRVIGRRGRVATAIRTVVQAAASKDGLDTEVEFVE